MKAINQNKNPLWQWKVMEYLSYFLVFLAPLYSNNDYILFEFGAPKSILIIGVIIVMIFLYLWGSLYEKKLSFRFTPLHVAIIFFLFLITLSSVVGIDPFNSFFGRLREGISLILTGNVYSFFISRLFSI